MPMYLGIPLSTGETNLCNSLNISSTGYSTNASYMSDAFEPYFFRPISAVQRTISA